MNLITRAILPIMAQKNITGEGQSQSGLGDIVASAFLAPSESKNGLTWGVGPVLLIPTATNDYLGGKKFGVGPTALVLKQIKGWTIGALVNQIWSIAGDKDRQDISTMFAQPFVNHNWKSGAGIGGNLEITQNSKADNTTIFFIPIVSGVTKLGTQTISLAVGPHIPITAPNGSKPD